MQWYGQEVDNSIVIAIITSVAALATAVVTGYFAQKAKKSEAAHTETKREIAKLKIELSCINILFNHEFLAMLNIKVDEIFELTTATRFLVLFAVNGKDRFNFVTVCYEKTKTHVGSGAIFRYVRFEIDDHYRQLIKDAEIHNHVYLDVERMPDSLLKSVYKSKVEGVRYSVIKFLKRINVDPEHDLVIYSSIVSTNQEPFTNNEMTTIKIAADAIRSAAKNISFTDII